MGANDPSEDDATDRVEPAPAAVDEELRVDGDAPPEAEGRVDGTTRVDVVWFPDDDDYIVVEAGNGDRAVRFHRFGRYGVGGLVLLFGSLGVVVLHGFLRSRTALKWPGSAVVVGIGVLLVAAYVRYRYDPETPPEVVARDVPVDEASETYDFEE